jgi:hypothetical protein
MNWLYSLRVSRTMGFCGDLASDSVKVLLLTSRRTLDYSSRTLIRGFCLVSFRLLWNGNASDKQQLDTDTL